MRHVALSLMLAAAPAQAGSLQPFDASSWQAILRTHAGRLTLVHFWGMTCGPCRVEMPKLGELLAKRPDIDVVTVDTDSVSATDEDAKDFLRLSGMPVADAWHFASPFAEKLYFSVDPQWQGEIPRTVLIGKYGRSIAYSGTLTKETLEIVFSNALGK